MSLAATHNRSEDHDFFMRVVGQDTFVDLFFRILDHLLPRHIGVSFAGAGKEKAHKIVDLCNRTYSGAGIPSRGFLFDANDRAEAIDFLYIRAFDTPQELAGVG